MSGYDWFPTFILFGPPGSGKTRFASHFMRYKRADGKDLGIEIADVGHGLFSWDVPPPADCVFPISSYEDFVNYLFTIEERNNDVIIIDDLSFLNYKLTMESAQFRGARDKDTPIDIKNIADSGKFPGFRFIPPHIKDRGVAAEKLRVMLYNLLDMKKILIITCGEKLEAEKISRGLGEDPIFTGKTFREPNLPGNMPNELPYFVSEVFYVYRVASAGAIQHKIRFLPDGSLVSCPKDRSGKLSQLAPNGVLNYDAEGKIFDKMIEILPWPEGMKPVLK